MNVPSVKLIGVGGSDPYRSERLSSSEKMIGVWGTRVLTATTGMAGGCCTKGTGAGGLAELFVMGRLQSNIMNIARPMVARARGHLHLDHVARSHGASPTTLHGGRRTTTSSVAGAPRTLRAFRPNKTGRWSVSDERAHHRRCVGGSAADWVSQREGHPATPSVCHPKPRHPIPIPPVGRMRSMSSLSSASTC